MDLKIGAVPRAKTILDVAFRRAKAKADEAKESIFRKDFEEKIRRVEHIRIQSAASNLCEQLEFVREAFPSYGELAPFYQELVKATMDYVIFKQSLGAMKWAEGRIRILQRQTAYQITTARIQQIHTIRAAFFGRASSVIEQVDGALKSLEEARKILKTYPTLKTSIPTVVIAGMPNSGKSTLLKAITGSNVEIKPYPFTTKQIMLGYKEMKNGKVQFVDTPGLLDRPLSERNPIEKQAVLALKHIATVILFVLDTSETGGYPLQDQLSLLREIRKNFTIPIIVVANKTDLDSKPVKDTLIISAEKGTGISEVAVAVEKAIATAT